MTWGCDWTWGSRHLPIVEGTIFNLGEESWEDWIFRSLIWVSRIFLKQFLVRFASGLTTWEFHKNIPTSAVAILGCWPTPSPRQISQTLVLMHPDTLLRSPALKDYQDLGQHHPTRWSTWEPSLQCQFHCAKAVRMECSTHTPYRRKNSREKLQNVLSCATHFIC